MKVDELLEKSIITPKFTYTEIKPKAGSLSVISHDSLDFINSDSLCHEMMETNDIKILIAFLRFAESAKQNVFQMKDIFDFIYTYGFPITQVIEFTEEGNKEGKLLGLNVDSFIQRLDNLYVCFALWKALQIGDADLIKRIQPFPLNRSEMQSELMRRLIPRINLTVLYFKDKPVLAYQAKDLLSLAEAQLAVLASKGDDYLNGGCIAYCSDCGQPFIKYRSNSTLCEACKGNTGKSRRYRAKKKGATSNG